MYDQYESAQEIVADYHSGLFRESYPMFAEAVDILLEEASVTSDSINEVK